MHELRINEHNYVAYRPTPWDARVFGFPTNELLDIRYEDMDAACRLLELFDQNNIREGIRFTYTRINATDKVLRYVLSRFSYYYAETSFFLTMNSIQKQDFAARFRNDLPLTEPAPADLEQIRIIARDSFDFSRFHEDYHIDEAKARDRYYRWIDDLVGQGKKFLVYKTGDVVKSFLAYSLSEGTVDLILAGSRKGNEMVSYYFWPSFMTYFQGLKCSRAKTVISASNTGIINLYAKLDFKFERTMLGFHKMY